MFRSLKLLIAIFYLITLGGYIALFYYLHDVLRLNLAVIVTLLAALGLFSAYMLARLATAPLMEYIEHLRLLSSQTLHELNLPIATIKSNLGMLKKSETDPKALKRLSRIESASQMLQQRYNELDYLIKTQTTLKIEEEFEICSLLKERVEFLQNLYPSHPIELQCEEAILKGDATGLAKSIDNLIDNSVKYSPKGSKIIVKYDNKSLRISDSGKGIDEVELIRIFDSYYQEDAASKGFGIGLSLVKKYCDKNDIELGIDSQVGQGTTVELKFKGQ